MEITHPVEMNSLEKMHSRMHSTFTFRLLIHFLKQQLKSIYPDTSVPQKIQSTENFSSYPLKTFPLGKL